MCRINYKRCRENEITSDFVVILACVWPKTIEKHLMKHYVFYNPMSLYTKRHILIIYISVILWSQRILSLKKIYYIHAKINWRKNEIHVFPFLNILTIWKKCMSLPARYSYWFSTLNICHWRLLKNFFSNDTLDT